MCQQRSFQVTAVLSVESPSDDSDLLVVESQFIDLIDSLVVTTDRLITGSRTASPHSARLSVQGTKPRIAPVPLMWSAASRVHRDFFVQASIEYVTSLPTYHLVHMFDSQSWAKP